MGAVGNGLKEGFTSVTAYYLSVTHHYAVAPC